MSESASADRPPGLPRWLKISLAVLGVLILLFVALKVAGLGGDHGPGRHQPDEDTPSQHSPGQH